MTYVDIPTAHAIEDGEEENQEEVDDAEIVNISDNMKKCYSLSITVKWFTFIDFIFSALIAFGNMFFFIPVFLAFTGYLGAKEFKKNYILIYFLYVLSNNIWRVTLYINLFNNADPDTRGDYTVNFILIILCSFLGLWIARIIYSFYRCITILTDAELDLLKNIRNHRDYYIILW